MTLENVEKKIELSLRHTVEFLNNKETACINIIT